MRNKFSDIQLECDDKLFYDFEFDNDMDLFSEENDKSMENQWQAKVRELIKNFKVWVNVDR